MGFLRLGDAASSILCATPTNLELKRALFDMNPSKAAGPDGFSAGFYQAQWNLIKFDFLSLCKDIMCNA